MSTGITIERVENVSALSYAAVEQVAAAVKREIWRQDSLARAGKFGGTHILPSGPDHARLAVVMEEVGEVAREINETLMGRENPGALSKELIQVAACCVAWAAALESTTARAASEEKE